MGKFKDEIVASTAAKPFNGIKTGSLFFSFFWVLFVVSTLTFASTYAPPLLAICIWIVLFFRVFPLLFIGWVDDIVRERKVRLRIIGSEAKAVMTDKNNRYSKSKLYDDI